MYDREKLRGKRERKAIVCGRWEHLDMQKVKEKDNG